MRRSAAPTRTGSSGPTEAASNLTASGINATDSNNLHSLYNLMLGRIGRIDQVFYCNGRRVRRRSSRCAQAAAAGVQLLRAGRLAYSAKLTINAGLRYELNSVPYDKRGVQVVPDKPLDGSQGPVTFLHGGTGHRTLVVQERQQQLGARHRLRLRSQGNGKTAIRGSYRISYQRLIIWALNVVEQRQPATSLNQFLLTPRDRAIGGTDRRFGSTNC